MVFVPVAAVSVPRAAVVAAEHPVQEVTVILPLLSTLNLLTAPTCRSIRREEALEAVSVTLALIKVGVPEVFQVAVKFAKDIACEPVRELLA